MQRQRRRWHFGNAIFDETAWTLTVAGQPAVLEPKPLELLRALLERAGEVVGKDELLEAVWPGVVVVEASLPTAISKLRKALGDEGSARPVIATVPRIGYRLTVPVHIEDALQSERFAMPPVPAVAPPPAAAKRERRGLVLAGMTALAAGLVGAAQIVGDGDGGATGKPTIAMPKPSLPEARQAVRRMDVAKLETMIAAGWDPETPFDNQQNGALNLLLERCEWDPGHDRGQMLVAARVLIDGGASLTRRNYWGDTAYSIAKAPRYCGADHPVTVMIRRLCTTGNGQVMAECEADYAGARRRRAAEVAKKIVS